MPHPQVEKKFIVFESCLRELVSHCPQCHAHVEPDFKQTGSAVTVTRNCNQCTNKSEQWHSQPKVHYVFVGNLLMSAASLFSGSLWAKTMRFLDIFGLARISRSQHFSHQKKYLHATVHKVWQTEQANLLQALKDEGRKLVLAGDGRSDTPGHCAKYGGYNVMECTKKRVLDVQVVQVSVYLAVIFRSPSFSIIITKPRSQSVFHLF